MTGSDFVPGEGTAKTFMLLNTSLLFLFASHESFQSSDCICRAVSKGIAQPQPEQQSEGLQSQTAASNSAPQDKGSSARDRVRQAMVELANSDSFIDLIMQQLQAHDLLRQ